MHGDLAPHLFLFPANVWPRWEPAVYLPLSHIFIDGPGYLPGMLILGEVPKGAVSTFRKNTGCNPCCPARTCLLDDAIHPRALTNHFLRFQKLLRNPDNLLHRTFLMMSFVAVETVSSKGTSFKENISCERNTIRCEPRSVVLSLPLLWLPD